MIRFNNDYNRGCIPAILAALEATNDETLPGYGTDSLCDGAVKLLRNEIGWPDADIHFLPGATQANFILHAAALRPIESVIAAQTGHIVGHEAGSVENTGHQILSVPCGPDGNLTAEQIARVAGAYSDAGEPEHLTEPRLVYISQPTEYGALYSLEELQAIKDICEDHELLLFVDGARMAYALGAENNDVTLWDLAALCDAFTIGGTKVGFLFGEAIVLTDEGINDCFRYHIKQRGGMLAKGRLLGVQFEAMLENGDYTRLAARANDLAQELKRAFVDHGCALFSDTAANQIFPILPDEAARRLATGYAFSFWERVDDTHQAVRFCTNVTTDRADVDALLRDIDRAF